MVWVWKIEMVRVSPLATASWVARVPHRRAATATAPRTARRARAHGAGSRTRPRNDPIPSFSRAARPSRPRRGAACLVKGGLAGNGYRPVKPTNPVVPSGALGRTMANSGPQRRAGPQRPAAMTVEGPDDVGVALPRHPPPARMLVHRHRRPHRGLGARRGAAARLPLRLRLGGRRGCRRSAGRGRAGPCCSPRRGRRSDAARPCRRRRA